MTIILKQLTITNFKGVKHLVIDFEKETNIYGDNATGKTTIFDAFNWLLFGKDSADSAKFNIKPLDKEGRPMEKTENEVSAVLIVDERRTELKRVHKEKWVKKRGEQISVFEGNEQEFYWNDVPMREKDYQAKISEMVNEGIFKMITNTLYFNQVMKWEARRNVLMSLAGTITNEEIAAGNPEFNAIIEMLTNKSLVEYKREISARKKKLKDDLVSIPTRVDEINRGLPDTLNWKEIESAITQKEVEISEIDKSINNQSSAHKALFEKIKQQMQEIHDLSVKRDAIAFEIKGTESSKANELTSNIKAKRLEIEGVTRHINADDKELSTLVSRRTALDKEIVELREKWNNVNAEALVFDDHEFNCPTCKRELEPGDIESKKAEMTTNFQTGKKRRLLEITEKGKRLAAEKSSSETRVNEIESEVETLSEHRGNLYAELQILLDQQSLPAVASIMEYKPQYAQIANLDEQIKALEAAKEKEPESDTRVFQMQKSELVREIDALKRQLATKEQIERSRVRIHELQTEEKNLAQQLADLEGTEFLIKKFEKAQIDTLEARINGKFQIVAFKLFNTLINGGVEECCETTVNGVPFPDLNTASKINAGIDIINVLCDHFNVHAPIFIDGRESITNIIDCDSQVINLIVKEGSPLTVDGVVVGKKYSKEMAA